MCQNVEADPMPSIAGLYAVPTPIANVAGIVQIIDILLNPLHGKLLSCAQIGAICAPQKSKSHYKLLLIN